MIMEELSTPVTEDLIRQSSTDESFRRGEEYFSSGLVLDPALRGNTLQARCRGNYSPFYRLKVELDGGGIRSAECSCQYDFGGYCKHLIALLLTYLRHPKQFAKKSSPFELLKPLSKERLLSLFEKLIDQKPDLADWVEFHCQAPSTSVALKKEKAKKVDSKVYKRRIHQILHSLDHLRPSEAYWQIGGLISELREIRQAAIQFLEAQDPETALIIFKALLSELEDCFETIDDSNGELGSFIYGLGRPLAEAILMLDLSASGRERLREEVSEWDRHFSDYGVDGLSVAVQAAEVGFNEDLLQKVQQKDEEVETDSDFAELIDAQLNVLKRQGRIREYMDLCQRSDRTLRYALELVEQKDFQGAFDFAFDHFQTAEEALKLAKLLREKNLLSESIRLGEKGLSLSGSKADLAKWIAPLFEAQNEKNKAIHAWLKGWEESPSLSIYQILKRLLKNRWEEERAKLLQSLSSEDKGEVLVEIHLFEEEWDRAIEKVQKMESYFYWRLLKKVIEKVSEYRPEWAIKASIREAEKLIEEAKSKYYAAAVDWLKQAKKAYLVQGKQKEWQKYFENLKEKYKRRPSLQEEFKKLEANG